MRQPPNTFRRRKKEEQKQAIENKNRPAHGGKDTYPQSTQRIMGTFVKTEGPVGSMHVCATRGNCFVSCDTEEYLIRRRQKISHRRHGTHPENNLDCLEDAPRRSAHVLITTFKELAKKPRRFSPEVDPTRQSKLFSCLLFRSVRTHRANCLYVHR